MQAPWDQRSQDGAGTSSGSPSPFHNSQSPRLKPTRPPPPYPHPKQEKPSPTSQSAAASLQFQAMKAGVMLSSAVKKEEGLFSAGCVQRVVMHLPQLEACGHFKNRTVYNPVTIRDGNVLLLKIPLLSSHSVFLLFRPCRGLANYDIIKIWPSDRDSLGPGYVDHLV